MTLRGTVNRKVAVASKAEQLEYRLRRIQRQVLLNKAELKHKHDASSYTLAAGSSIVIDLTDIAQGDLENQRTGNHVRIHGVKIRHYSGNAIVDSYLTLSPTGETIAKSNFVSFPGGFIGAASDTDHKELQYLSPRNFGGIYQYSRKFRKPLEVKYANSGSTTAATNRLQVLVKNDGTTTHTGDINIITYYTDA